MWHEEEMRHKTQKTPLPPKRQRGGGEKALIFCLGSVRGAKIHQFFSENRVVNQGVADKVYQKDLHGKAESRKRASIRF